MENSTNEATVSKGIVTEIGQLSKLPNKTIRNFFDKLNNHENCAAHFGKCNLDANREDYINIAHECRKESRLLLLPFQIHPQHISN